MRSIEGVLRILTDDSSPGKELRCAHCNKDSHSLYEISLRGRRSPFVACYKCFQANSAAMSKYATALEKEMQVLQDDLRLAQTEIELARLSAPEHHELLRQERATLNLLSMDSVYTDQARLEAPVDRILTSGHYDCVQVKAYGQNFSDEVTRSNLRQAAQELGKSWYGEEWVERMLHWGEVQRYTNLDEEEGMNPWSGLTRKSAFDLEETHREELYASAQERDEIEEASHILERMLPSLGEREALSRLLAPLQREEEESEKTKESNHALPTGATVEEAALSSEDRKILLGWWERLTEAKKPTRHPRRRRRI